MDLGDIEKGLTDPTAMLREVNKCIIREVRNNLRTYNQ